LGWEGRGAFGFWVVFVSSVSLLFFADMNEIFHEKESVTKPLVSYTNDFSGVFWAGISEAFVGLVGRVCEAGEVN